MSDERPSKVMTTEEKLSRINRPLPWSDEAERGVLSCLMQDPQRILEVRGRLPAEAFYHPSWRCVYEALLEMSDKAQPIEMPALTMLLKDRQQLDSIGGAAEISDLFSFTPISSHWPFYTKQVLDKWGLRKAVHACAESIDELLAHGQEQTDEDVAAVVGRAESRVFDCLEQVKTGEQQGRGAVTARDAVLEWVDHMQVVMDNRGKLMGLPSGLFELDQTFHGFDDNEGEIVTIAARPSMGKSSMARTISHHLAVEQRIPGVVFSIEESKSQWLGKEVLGFANVPVSKMITGHFSGERWCANLDNGPGKKPGGPTGEFAAWQKMAKVVAESPLFINADSQLSTADLRAQVQVLKRQHGIRWIMVDHLHLVKGCNPKTAGDERLRLVEVMETLQFIKKEHKVVVFLMVQMNRESDKNLGKPPVLADLSGSAAIEQFSDSVIFIHREDFNTKWHRLSQDAQNTWRQMIIPRRERAADLGVPLWSGQILNANGQFEELPARYDENEGGFARADWEEKALLFVRKNRRGPTPELQVRFLGEYARFTTRMPSLNSSDPRDWQMGTYTVQKAKPQAEKAGTWKPGKWSKQNKGTAADDGWENGEFKG